MDPDATLKRLRDLLSLRNPSRDVVDEIRELFSAIDEWLSKGGFFPKAWSYDAV